MKEFLVILALMGGLTDSETLRFTWSSEQGFDTSCGYSTLVAFMETWWGIEITEEQLIEETFMQGKIDDDFRVSFKTMAEILTQHGFSTKTFRMDFEQLLTATEKYAPLIIHLDGEMGHFAVLLGITDDTIILADPAQGTRFMKKNEFCKSWSGNVLLAVSKEDSLQKTKLAKATTDTLARKKMLEKTTTIMRRQPR